MMNSQSTPEELEYLLRILKAKFLGEEERIEPSGSSGESATRSSEGNKQPSAKDQPPKRLARVRRKTVMPS